MPLSNVTGFYIPISSPHLPAESCTCLIYWPLDIPGCNFYKLLLKLFPSKAILLCLRKGLSLPLYFHLRSSEASSILCPWENENAIIQEFWAL